MYFFKDRLRYNLPLLFLILCIVTTILYSAPIVLSLRSYSSVYSFPVLFYTFAQNVGLGIFVFVFRKKKDWMITNITYFFLCYVLLIQFNFIIITIFFYIENGYSIRSSLSELGPVSLIILLYILLLALTYKKGILKNLFVQKGYIIDRMLFSFIFTMLLSTVIISGIQLWLFYRNIEGFGFMNNNIVQSIFLLLLFSLIFIVNIVQKPDIFVTRSFNLVYMIFILFMLFRFDFVKYSASLHHYFGEDDPFSFLDYLKSIRLSGYGMVLLFYIIIKTISYKDTKLYMDQIKKEEEEIIVVDEPSEETVSSI